MTGSGESRRENEMRNRQIGRLPTPRRRGMNNFESAFLLPNHPRCKNNIVALSAERAREIA